MNLYVYSDESGTFDRQHSAVFAFGGLVFTDGEALQSCHRRYAAVERAIREHAAIPEEAEVKASDIAPKLRKRLLRVTNREVRFGTIIELSRLHPMIDAHQKHKQRYLDYAFQCSVRRCLESLITSGEIVPEEVTSLSFFADQHTTATSGRYELTASLEQEFGIGSFNRDWTIYRPPLFPNLASLKLKYCNSEDNALIRAADIIANDMYRNALYHGFRSADARNYHVIQLP